MLFCHTAPFAVQFCWPISSVASWLHRAKWSYDLCQKTLTKHTRTDVLRCTDLLCWPVKASWLRRADWPYNFFAAARRRCGWRDEAHVVHPHCSIRHLYVSALIADTVHWSTLGLRISMMVISTTPVGNRSSHHGLVHLFHPHRQTKLSPSIYIGCCTSCFMLLSLCSKSIVWSLRSNNPRLPPSLCPHILRSMAPLARSGPHSNPRSASSSRKTGRSDSTQEIIVWEIVQKIIVSNIKQLARQIIQSLHCAACAILFCLAPFRTQQGAPEITDARIHHRKQLCGNICKR